jgi:carbamoyltransferase
MYNTLSIYGSHDSSVTFIDNEGGYCVLEYERFVKKRYAAFSNNFKAEEDPRVGCGTTEKQRRQFLSYIKKKLDREINTILYNELSKEDMDLISQYFPNAVYKKMEHHRSHAYCAYYQSGFNKAIIVSIDGGGMDYDGVATTKVYLAEGDNIKTIYRSTKNLGNSYGAIGYLISDIRHGLDSKVFCLSYAGKTMGICAYGNHKEEWLPTMRKFYETGGHGFSLLEECIGTTPSLNCIGGQKAYDLAATSQYVFEEECMRIILPFVKKYNCNVVMTGGCALNVLYNQRIHKIIKKLGSKLYVPPNPNDCGLSLGQMLIEYPRQINEVVYNGFEVLDKEDLPMHIENRKATKINAKGIAELLKKGKIVGLVYGNSEVGPRALGNRSIICDPSFLDMKEILNKKVKFREWYRPFAPACLLEDANKYFVNPRESNYMSYAPAVKKEYRAKLPSIVHQDGTARLQTVTKDQHYVFWSILEEMKNQSAIPVILNTSFNIKGLPILTTIEDALFVLDNTEMDYVVIEDYLFEEKR